MRVCPRYCPFPMPIPELEFVFAAEGKYAWLNRSIFVASGARHANSIKLWLFEVR